MLLRYLYELFRISETVLRYDNVDRTLWVTKVKHLLFMYDFAYTCIWISKEVNGIMAIKILLAIFK